MDYSTSVIEPYRTVKDNLLIDLFAKKHGMSIAEVEKLLKKYKR